MGEIRHGGGNADLLIALRVDVPVKAERALISHAKKFVTLLDRYAPGAEPCGDEIYLHILASCALNEPVKHDFSFCAGGESDWRAHFCVGAALHHYIPCESVARGLL